MRRREVLLGSALTLAAPHVGRAQATRTLRFVPQADLAALDPIASVAYVTRNHALMVFDTLYGVDAENRAQPQMLAGHGIDDDGKTWTLNLREGLRFHDGTPVLRATWSRACAVGASGTISARSSWPQRTNWRRCRTGWSGSA